MVVRLEARNLAFRYDGHSVLCDVCLDVARGEILSVVGPNGSGKSTLLKCLDRILMPNGGTVLVDGKEVARMDPADLAVKVGYVPQSGGRASLATVFDAVMLGRRPKLGFRVQARDRRAVWEAMELLSIAPMAKRAFDELSGGERQRVLIARALAQETEILLLDEPTSNLDIRYQLEVLELVERMRRERGIAIVMAMHDLNLVARFTDRIALIHRGDLFAVGPPDGVLTEENICKVYGVHSRIEKDGSGRLAIFPLNLARD